MRIRKTYNNLTWLQNYPDGKNSNRKKDWLDTQLKTPNLASLVDPIRQLLKKENITNNKIQRLNSHTITLEKIKAEIPKITEQNFWETAKVTLKMWCKPHRHRGCSRTTIPRRVVPKTYTSRFLIAYASRLLNEAELKYSTNEIELLAVVWATDHFKYYLLGSKFELITDHIALLSALKPNRANKSRQSRFSSWVDKLLPYTFTINLLPGKDMGFTDHLSRNPHLNPPPINADGELFVINRINAFTFTLPNEERKHKISSNQIAPFGNRRKSHDAISKSQPAQNKANAFCHLSRTKQSHINSFSNPISLCQNTSNNLNSSSNSIKSIRVQI